MVYICIWTWDSLNEMAIQFHVFSFVVLYKITCNTYDSLIITIKTHRSFDRKLGTANNIFNHRSSHIPCVMDINFVFVLDLATVDYFLLQHITRLPLTNGQKTEVDLWSNIDPAQSASIYTSTLRWPCLL